MDLRMLRPEEEIVVIIKKSPVKGRGNLMFSQRNNPYCDLLHFSLANIENIFGNTILSINKKNIFEKNIKI